MKKVIQVTLSDERTITLRAPNFNDLSEFVQFNSVMKSVKAVFNAIQAINEGVIVPVPDISGDLERAYPLMAKLSGISIDELHDLPLVDTLAIYNEVSTLANPKAKRPDNLTPTPSS